MKPDFKVNFAKRDVIACVCFTVVMILVLVLGNTFGFVSAEELEEGTCTLNYQDFSNSDYYNSDILSNSINLPSEPTAFGQSIYSHIENSDLDFSSVTGLNGSSIKYFAFASYQASALYVYLFTGNTYFCSKPGYTSFFTDGDMYRVTIDIYVVNQDSGYYGFGLVVNNSSLISIPNNNGNYGNYRRIDLTLDQKIHYSNMPLYCPLNDWNSNNSFVDVFDAFNSSVINNNLDSSFINYNYFIDGIYGFTGMDNLENINPGGLDDETETSSNNLYLNNPYWSFNMPHNNQLTSTNGTATFNAVPTEYQLEHPNQFELHYWFQIDVTYTFKDSGDGGFSGAGHGFSILNSIRPHDSLGTTVTRSRTGIFKYRYDGSDSAVVPFSDFDGSQTFQTITVGSGWNKIFRQCYLSGNTSYNTFYDWWKDYGRTTATDNESLPIVTSAKLKCYAQLYDSTSSSGICAYYYDFLTGDSGVLDDSMGVNSNPYDFDTQDQFSDSSSGYGYVVQNNNNNQSVVINNNSGVSSDDTDDLKDQLEATLGDEQGGLIDTFKSKAQSNGWLMLMNSIFGFVPNSIWVDLATFLATCLGIFVVFLILRFLLDLL